MARPSGTSGFLPFEGSTRRGSVFLVFCPMTLYLALKQICAHYQRSFSDPLTIRLVSPLPKKFNAMHSETNTALTIDTLVQLYAALCPLPRQSSYPEQDLVVEGILNDLHFQTYPPAEAYQRLFWRSIIDFYESQGEVGDSSHQTLGN